MTAVTVEGSNSVTKKYCAVKSTCILTVPIYLPESLVDGRFCAKSSTAITVWAPYECQS